MMTGAERDDFELGIEPFDWDKTIQSLVYGLRRYYFKEDVLSPLSHS